MNNSRIALERKKLGLSQEELANKLKISQKSVSKYERGTRRPSYETLVAMSSIFGVTVDYLLGNDNAGIGYQNYQMDAPEFRLDLKYRLKETLEEKGTSESVDYLVGNSNDRNNSDSHNFFFFFFSRWAECKQRILQKLDELSISELEFAKNTGLDLEKEISIDDLILISKTLKVSTDYLLGIENPEIIHSKSIQKNSEPLLQTLSDREQKILNAFRLLNEDYQDIIIGDTKKYIREQNLGISVATDETHQKTGTNALGKSYPSNGTEG